MRAVLAAFLLLCVDLFDVLTLGSTNSWSTTKLLLPSASLSNSLSFFFRAASHAVVTSATATKANTQMDSIFGPLPWDTNGAGYRRRRKLTLLHSSCWRDAKQALRFDFRYP
jgi:hypothetical protein